MINYSYNSHNVNVKEVKAPTDESLKLLKEYEEKARERLLSHEIIDNNLKLSISLFRKNMISNTIEYFVKFNLNGEEYNIENVFELNRLKHKDFDDIINDIYIKISNVIAVNILNEASKDLKNFFNQAKI